MTELSETIKELRELIDEADYYELGERLYRRGSYLLINILEAADKAERYERALMDIKKHCEISSMGAELAGRPMHEFMAPWYISDKALAPAQPKCKTCGGSGQWEYRITGSKEQYTKSKCMDCNGTGVKS